MLSNLNKSKPIRLAIDGYYLDKPRGLGRYVQELLFCLEDYSDSLFEITIFTHTKTTTRLLELFPKLRFQVLPMLPFPIWEQVLLPMLIGYKRFDVVHFPYNTKPMAVNMMNVAHVVTLHDLTFLRETGFGLYQRVGALYRSIVTRLALRNGDCLVTDSIESRRDIFNVFALTAAVVPISVESLLKNSVDLDANNSFQYNSKYFIHIGGISPHKNTINVIEAFTRLNLKGVSLIILGVPMDADIASARRSDMIHFPGWLNVGEIVRLIRNAICMVFPSLREGYGLPIVESFALGCPVITSNIPPMSELAGDCALLVDPASCVELVDAMQRLYYDSDLRSVLIAKGLERMSLFSGEVMASKMISIYKSAIDNYK